MWKCCWSWTGVVTANPTHRTACAEQMVWNRVPLGTSELLTEGFFFSSHTQPLSVYRPSRFSGCFLEWVSRNGFDLFTQRGNVARWQWIKGFHWGRGKRKRRGKVLCGAGRMRRCCLNVRGNTQALFSLVSLAQCGTYIAHTFTAHFVMSLTQQGCACSRPNVHGVIQMMRQINLKWQDSCCTSPLSSILVSCMDLMYTPMTHWYSTWVLKLRGFYGAHHH